MTNAAATALQNRSRRQRSIPHFRYPFPVQVLKRIFASCALPSMVWRFAKADLS
jgi:hypothetical protein